MVGRIMKAKDANQKYGNDMVMSQGKNFTTHNTDGRLINVKPDDLIYHRGNGNFAPYSSLRDAHRKSSGSDPLHIGKGDYRQTNDRKKRK